MARQPHCPLPLPKNWSRRVRSAVVQAISLARLALTTARGQAREAGTSPGRDDRRLGRTFTCWNNEPLTAHVGHYTHP